MGSVKYSSKTKLRLKVIQQVDVFDSDIFLLEDKITDIF